MFPKQVQMVGGIALGQLRDTALWPPIERALSARFARQLQQIRDACHIAPLETIEQIELAADPERPKDAFVIVVSGKFSRAQVNHCAQTLSSAERGTPLAIVDDGALTSYSDGTATLWAGWPEDDTIVIGYPGRKRQWMADRLAGRNSIRDDGSFMELLGNVDSSATAWGAFLDRDGTLRFLAGGTGGEAPRALFASLRLATRGARGEVGLSFASAAAAQTAAEAIRAAVDGFRNDPQLGGIASSARIGAYGLDAVVEIDLNKQQLEQIVQITGSLPF
jgi:hypothetical protein